MELTIEGSQVRLTAVTHNTSGQVVHTLVHLLYVNEW